MTGRDGSVWYGAEALRGRSSGAGGSGCVIGFTGPRHGMTRPQASTVAAMVAYVLPSLAVHGDCVGADEAFDFICVLEGVRRRVYPGMDARGESPSRAWCDAEEVSQVRPYLERNRLIVRESDVLIATPDGPEQKRSGTWATVRFAWSVASRTGAEGPVLWVVLPNGDLDLDWQVS